MESVDVSVRPMTQQPRVRDSLVIVDVNGVRISEFCRPYVVPLGKLAVVSAEAAEGI